MKTLIFNFFCGGFNLFAFIVCMAAVCSCDMLGGGMDKKTGELRIAFARGQESLTRAGVAIPDTSDFLLTIRNSKGEIFYDGRYADSPEALPVEAGSYTVSIVSEQFSKPAFSAPQFGDEQCIIVPAGKSVDVKLVCRQINSGIRLLIDSGFLTEYPNGVLMLKSAAGRLVYGYSEKRIAYFKPGDVSLVLNEGASDKVLMTKTLLAQDILELKVMVAGDGGTTDASADGKGSMSVQVDTARNWLTDAFAIGGGGNSGNGTYDALTVAEAQEAVGEEDVWVCGHIVGGDLTSSSASFSAPFESRNCLLLGPRTSTTSKASCLSVQLPSGELRDALNLVDNPELLGRKVCIRGNIVEAYYGIPGLKNITEYEFL